MVFKWTKIINIIRHSAKIILHFKVMFIPHPIPHKREQAAIKILGTEA